MASTACACVRAQSSKLRLLPSLLASRGSTRRMGTVRMILLESVDNTGYRGEEVAVRAGYARNFLYPNRKAVYATEENRSRYKTVEESEDAASGRAAAELLKTKERLDTARVVFKRHSTDGMALHSEVNAKNVSDYLKKWFGIDVGAASIALPEGQSIKTTGDHSVIVTLTLRQPGGTGGGIGGGGDAVTGGNSDSAAAGEAGGVEAEAHLPPEELVRVVLPLTVVKR